MKVLIINGSPHKENTTKRALLEVSNTLNNEGIETEIIDLPTDIGGCLGCGYCKKEGKCVQEDLVNEINEKMAVYDGLIVGSPVHFANPSAPLIAFLDRLFYSGNRNNYAFKPAAAITVSRRAGNTVSFDALNKFFTISNMIVIGSSYWNEVYGFNGEQAEMDLEGLQTMRNLGRNMAYYLKIQEAGEKAGIKKPEIEKGNRTSWFN